LIKPTSVIYYSRLTGGIIMGIVSTLLSGYDHSGYTQLSLAITAYLFTYYILRFGFKIDPTKLRSKNQILTLGIGTFFLVWILVWVLTYTVFVGSSQTL
jgi:hypothetical protein